MQTSHSPKQKKKESIKNKEKGTTSPNITDWTTKEWA